MEILEFLRISLMGFLWIFKSFRAFMIFLASLGTFDLLTWLHIFNSSYFPAFFFLFQKHQNKKDRFHPIVINNRLTGPEWKTFIRFSFTKRIIVKQMR
jgi:hypothetical protein